jgi:hypothetical protein
MTEPMRCPRLPHRAGGRPWLILAVVAGLLAGCTPHLGLYPKIEELARAGQYEAAAAFVEKNRAEYGDRNAVLYHLDRGLLLHYAGRYAESNRAFEAAERRMDELFTESVSGHALAFALNDNTLPYRGEDFETVVVNLYRALNYVQLGQVDEAIVEARKVNLKLERINAQYAEGEKNVYKEDAFARLLAGVLYEMGGTRDDVNDAFISDRLAVKAYRQDFAHNYNVQVPDALARNLLTTAEFMGAEETAEARKQFPAVEPIPLVRKQEQGQLYFVHFAGRSPVKVEDAIRAQMLDGNLLKIAFPRYKPSYYVVNGARIVRGGEVLATLEPAQPLGAIAVENLDNRKGRIAVKAIARATAKYLANKALQERAKKESQSTQLLAFVAGTVFTEVSEQADLRSWRTLPDRVLIGRAMLPPGKHVLQAQFLTGGTNVVGTRDLGEVEVAAGQTRFLILHTLQ